MIALLAPAGPAGLDDAMAATGCTVAARSFTSGTSIHSVGFLATSRQSYSISSVSRGFLRCRGEAILCRLYRAGTRFGGRLAERTATRQPHKGACQQLKLSRQAHGLRDYSEAH